MSIDINMIIEYVKYLIEVSVLVGLGMLVYRMYANQSKENKTVKKQAFTDQLTGRGNRYMFQNALDKLIAKKKKFAVCFMDLDGFKQINDTMGHDAGDELLIALSNTFESKLPKNATAYRLGGDEFSIVIENIKTVEDITKLLDNLKKELNEPFDIAGTKISLQYSLGVAIYPEDADNRTDLLKYADDAMYYIKEHGKNGYYFHNKSLKAKLENDTKMQADLKKAFEENQFNFSMQPRINVKDASLLCFEALLYWNHPVLGKLTSDYFIKQADEMALTIKLDQYVLEKVCDKLEELKEKGFKNIEMAVNISNRHVVKKEFIDRLCEILNEHNIQKGEIKLELTGSIEANKVENYKIMFERLRNCGAEIVVNNIEIKYETLALFKDLQIDEIKLSSFYVAESSKLPVEVLENIVALCKNLDYKVILGRIDEDCELANAIKSGADSIQGNLIFKAMDEEFVETFLNEYSNYKNRIENIIIMANKRRK